jgi:hypothetical protein
MGDFVTEIRKIPPITRFVCASCLAVTLSTMMGLVSGYQFIYTFSLAFKKLQVSGFLLALRVYSDLRLDMAVVYELFLWKWVLSLCYLKGRELTVAFALRRRGDHIHFWCVDRLYIYVQGQLIRGIQNSFCFSALCYAFKSNALTEYYS